MNLKSTIDQDIKNAILAKDKEKLRALRAIKSMILLAETETGSKSELAPEDEIKLLTKAVKQRNDSITIFSEQNREDLAKKEQAELEVIKSYLPEQLSQEKVENIIKKIIKETGASNLKHMGKVMGEASKQLAGKADGKLIASIVKHFLN